MSGGYYQQQIPSTTGHFETVWTTPGRGPSTMVSTDSVITRLLGLPQGMRRVPTGKGLNFPRSLYTHRRTPHSTPSQLSSHKPPTPGFALLSSRAKSQPWTQTEAGGCFPQPSGTTTAAFRLCRTCTITNGDTCAPYGFVLFNRGGERRIARVREILRRKGSTADDESLAEWVLLAVMSTSSLSPQFHMPVLQDTGTQVLATPHVRLHTQLPHLSMLNQTPPPQELLCTVNVQHNCPPNGCNLTGTQPILEEREDTGRTAPAVHHINPNDIVLNLAQMRDSALLRPWLPLVSLQDRDILIDAACAREHLSRLQRAEDIQMSD
jgi:hypothetical protein